MVTFYDVESSTLDVNTSIYINEEAGLAVTLVDTPGFDDSRKGVTDTYILGKITSFLQDDGGRKLNGLIYLHRISDNRMGGSAKKNLRMFTELCGSNNLKNVCIVTTFWSRVEENEGNQSEESLAKGPFKALIDGGAKMLRQDKGLESAKLILSELIRKSPVTLKIQEELNTGSTLGDTSAGGVIVEEMKEFQKKHNEEVESLKKEMEEAVETSDEDLRAELAAEYQKLENMMARAGEDQKILGMAREVRSTDEAETMQRAMDEHMKMTTNSPNVALSVELHDTVPQEPREEIISNGNYGGGSHGRRRPHKRPSILFLDRHRWSFSSVWQSLEDCKKWGSGLWRRR